MSGSGARQYQFGPYRIDDEQRLLHRGPELIPLPPKVAETLVVLLASAGRMVEKADLMKAVWPDTFVEEGALARNISLLRKTLEDDGGENSYIETIPRRGYRFTAPVQTNEQIAVAPPPPVVPAPLTPEAIPEVVPVPRFAIAGSVAIFVVFCLWAAYALRAPSPPAPGARPAPRTSLAVLPLRNLAPDGTEDYFAQGMSQAIITSLSRRGDLRVVSFVSSPAGQTQAALLEAVAGDNSIQRALTGTVLRSGGNIRIDVQLTDPNSRGVHWANSYQRDASDVFALQNAVSEAIASELPGVQGLKQPPGSNRQSTSPEALDWYLRGRYLTSRRTEEGLHRAVEYFQKAIAADPKYAPAYSGLADAWALLGSVGIDGMKPTESMPLAKAAAEKAVALDPELADAHTSLAYVHLSYDWDLDAAAKEFARALDLNPSGATAHQWYSHYFMAKGDLARATDEMAVALRLEPMSPIINVGMGWCAYYSKQYTKAIGHFRFVTEMDPSFPLGHQTLGMALLESGQNAEAVEEYRKAAALGANSPTTLSGLATAYAEAGRMEEANQTLARLVEISRARYVPALYFANIYLSLHDMRKALDWGWQALNERSDYLMYIRVEPRGSKFGANPEFLRLLAKFRG